MPFVVLAIFEFKQNSGESKCTIKDLIYSFGTRVLILTYAF